MGKSFQTTDGEELEIISFGELNKSSGPDFLEAQLKYDDKLWAGHIEFHIKSSDWLKHGHQHDEAYNNVIAHFVLEHDKEIFSGSYKLPVVELKDQILEKAFKPSKTKNWIPCEKMISSVDTDVVNDQLDSAVYQRLERKKQEAIMLFREHDNDHKRVMLILIARILGGRHNANAMETLVTKIDFQTFNYIRSTDHSFREFIIGLSGLESSSHFNYLSNYFQIKPMAKVEWKTYGMRPSSQPIKRLEQLAAIILKIDEMDFEANQDQWRAFFSFGDYQGVSALSNPTKDLIMINALVPFLLAMSWFKSDDRLKRKAHKLLKSIPPEKNAIVKRWSQLGLNAENALETQALLELKNGFCNEKKCLFCDIGQKVLKS